MPVGPPSHRRVRLGYALRDARNMMELSQLVASKKGGMSQAKLAKLENAQIVHVKMVDLNSLMTVYGIAGAEAEELRRFARSPYSQSGTYVETSPNAEWWQELQQIEQDARVIKAVHLQAHDGLIQCEQYMRRQLEFGSSVNIDAKVQARLDRQKAVLDQNDPPDCTFILDEACLHTTMGDPAMMAVQLKHLLTLMERPQITILVKPANAAFSASNYGWTFLQFRSTTMRDFVSVQYAVGATTIDDDDALRVFQTRWEQIRGASLSESGSRKFIRRVLTEIDL